MRRSSATLRHDGQVDATRALLLREVLSGTGWVQRVDGFALSLRRRLEPQGLLLVGTEQEEPWHLAAHLSDEARIAALPELEPTLVRWSPPPGAPAHLAVGLDRLRVAGRRDSLLVVSPEALPGASGADLLERVNDARRAGATIFSVDGGDPELEALAHEALPVPAPAVPSEAVVDLDTVQHLLAGSAARPLVPRIEGARQRLGRLLDRVSGPAPVPRRMR